MASLNEIQEKLLTYLYEKDDMRDDTNGLRTNKPKAAERRLIQYVGCKSNNEKLQIAVSGLYHIYRREARAESLEKLEFLNAFLLKYITPHYIHLADVEFPKFLPNPVEQFRYKKLSNIILTTYEKYNEKEINAMIEKDPSIIHNLTYVDEEKKNIYRQTIEKMAKEEKTQSDNKRRESEARDKILKTTARNGKI